jgi:glycosyltransferase involved in cell wall biosynthesis
MKNLGAIIKLLPEDRTWHAAFAGQGPSRAALEQLAAELGVSERVHFLGELTPDGIGSFLKAIDVFVFPSLAETFGLAAVEAAQAGVPVVSNDLEVLREVLITDGQESAVFADATNTQDLSAAVRGVLNDPALRERLIQSGKRLAGRYPADKMVGAYKDLLETCR